jgi:hypothetical protein
MFDYFEFWLIVLSMLVVYLCVSVERRLRAEEARSQEEIRQLCERYPIQAASDVSAIAPRIQQLRRDHLAAFQARPHQAFFRRGLIAAILQVVTTRSYFYRVRLEHDTQNHDASVRDH